MIMSINNVISLAVILFSLAPVQAQKMEELRSKTLEKYEKVVTSGKIPTDLQPLYSQLEDRTPSVRKKAVQSLGLIGGPMGALLLVRSINDSLEKNTSVRIEAAKSLGDIGGRQALESLGFGLDDRNATVRKRTVEALRWAGTVFAVPYIQAALRKDREVGVRLEAVKMLRKIGTQFSIQPLAEALMEDRNKTVRKSAADALGEIGKKERQAARSLGEAYRQERNLGVKLEIVGSLGLMRDRAGLPFLQEAMKDRNLTVRLRATEIYGRVLGLQ